MLGIGGTGKGRATEILKGLGFSRALCAPVFIHAPLGLGAAMCGVDQHPALGHPSIGGCQQVIAIALRQGLIVSGIAWASASCPAVSVAGTRVIHLLPVVASFWRLSSLESALSATREVVP